MLTTDKNSLKEPMDEDRVLSAAEAENIEKEESKKEVSGA